MKKWLLIISLLVAVCPVSQAQLPNMRSSEVVLIDGQDYYIHTVRGKETLYSLSRLYDVPVERIMADNSLKGEDIKVDQILKIYCKNVPEVTLSKRRMARIFNEHIVAQGETAYSIARRYSISLNTLIQDNPGIDPTRLDIGYRLLVRKSETGETSPREILSEMDEYALKLTAVSGDFVYHVVDIGETLYSLGRQYGTTEYDIRRNNDISDGLKAGSIIKIPVDKGALAQGPQGGEQPGTVPYVPPGRPYRPGGTTEPGKPGEGLPGFPEGSEDPATSEWPGYLPQTKIDYVYKGLLNVAMLLPLSEPGTNRVKDNFVEFYMGALLALEDLKDKGYYVQLDLYDTQRSLQKVRHIVQSPDFAKTNLIIGPVYEESLPPVMRFARRNGVPVVSPLAAVNSSWGDILYQMSPDPEKKYDKMRHMFDGDKNIVFITTDNTDAEFEREMAAVVGDRPYQRVEYNRNMPGSFIDQLLVNPQQENVFVVLSGNETGVEQVLAALSSVQNNRLARSIRTGPMKVIGNSRWLRYPNLEKNLWFKMNVSLVANYHGDRSNGKIRAFDNRYMAAFGDVPNLYSYRGYDAVMLFGEAMMGRPDRDFNSRLRLLDAPLQSSYSFEPDMRGNLANTSWALVTYTGDYKVIVE